MRVTLGLVVLAVLASVGLPVVAVLGLAGAAGGTGAHLADGALPAEARADYVAAAATCPGLGWTVLAGIGEVESDHGRSTLPGVHAGANPWGAEGPMQFLPATFAAYAVPPPGGGVPSPYNLRDAAFAAARLLCASGGGDPASIRSALWAYNHSSAYADAVLSWAAVYAAAAGPAVGGSGGAAAGATGGTAGPGDGAAAGAAAWALAQVGLPYVWGAAGPGAFDCSGLVMRAYEAVGVRLPRVAAQQYGSGELVPFADAALGDLVFFAPDPADPSTIDHVGMVLGDGLMVEAPHPGATVRVVPIYAEGRLALVTRPVPTG